MNYKKKPDQTWKDLAQEMKVLSIKAYGGMEERYTEELSIQDDDGS